MKINWNKKYTTIAAYCCIVIFISMLLASIMLNIGDSKDKIFGFFTIFNPLIYGFVIAFLVNPIMRFFENKVFKFWKADGKVFKFKRSVALILAFLVVFTLIGLFIYVLVPQLIESYKDLVSKFGDYIKELQAWITHTFGKDSKLPKWIVSFINSEEMVANLSSSLSDAYNWVLGITPDIFSFVGSIVTELKNALIGIIFSIYFLYSKERLFAVWKKILYAFFSKKKVGRILRVGSMTKRNFEGFFVGKIIDSIIIGVLTFFVLMIFRMPYYPLVAVIVGVTNIIPFFGPFIGAIPGAFIIFIADPVKALWFLLIILIIQQLDGNVIGPKILGINTNLSALGVMIAIILMTGLLGITGMFIGVPIFSVLYAMFFEMVDKRLIAKGRMRNVNEYKGNKHGKLDITESSDDEDEVTQESPKASEEASGDVAES
ncbi:MAG: AI-2E family transporter [Ruminococcaceae bacterium]|nr:AI-2E family transporter [Oscillospiraceae bacterium]